MRPKYICNKHIDKCTRTHPDTIYIYAVAYIRKWDLFSLCVCDQCQCYFCFCFILTKRWTIALCCALCARLGEWTNNICKYTMNRSNVYGSKLNADSKFFFLPNTDCKTINSKNFCDHIANRPPQPIVTTSARINVHICTLWTVLQFSIFLSISWSIHVSNSTSGISSEWRETEKIW